MYVLAGMLVFGFVVNLMVRPVAARWLMTQAETAASQAKSANTVASGLAGDFGIGRGGLDAAALAAWAVVGIPILWGVWITLSNAFILFL